MYIVIDMHNSEIYTATTKQEVYEEFFDLFSDPVFLDMDTFYREGLDEGMLPEEAAEYAKDFAKDCLFGKDTGVLVYRLLKKHELEIPKKVTEKTLNGVIKTIQDTMKREESDLKQVFQNQKDAEYQKYLELKEKYENA